MAIYNRRVRGRPPGLNTIDLILGSVKHDGKGNWILWGCHLGGLPLPPRDVQFCVGRVHLPLGWARDGEHCGG